MTKISRLIQFSLDMDSSEMFPYKKCMLSVEKFTKLQLAEKKRKKGREKERRDEMCLTS